MRQLELFKNHSGKFFEEAKTLEDFIKARVETTLLSKIELDNDYDWFKEPLEKLLNKPANEIEFLGFVDLFREESHDEETGRIAFPFEHTGQIIPFPSYFRPAYPKDTKYIFKYEYNGRLAFLMYESGDFDNVFA